MEERRRIGAMGGTQKGINARKRKALREVLEAALNEPSAADGNMTRMEYLVAKCLDNHRKGRLNFGDLKILQDILGESATNINLNADAPVLMVSPEAAAKLAKPKE